MSTTQAIRPNDTASVSLSLLGRLGVPWMDVPGRQQLPTISAAILRTHPTDTLTILEEGSAPLPKCEHCGMHVTYLSLNTSHYNSTVCRAGAARERQRCAIQDARRAREVVFMVHGTQLEAVSEF